MKRFLFFTFLLTYSLSYGQRDSIPLGTKYKEDQIYLSLSYNQLFNQPTGVSSSGFSYGFNAGVIKDIPINKQGSWALGIGVGYSFNSFNHGLQIDSQNGIDTFSIDNVLDENSMSIHSIDIPFEIRWRNSNAQRYNFWRVYPGFKLSYNLKNSFSSTSNGVSNTIKNIDSFKDLQYGLTLSVGYDAFNLNVYYSLSPLFENATLNGESIDTKMIRVGLIVYIL